MEPVETMSNGAVCRENTKGVVANGNYMEKTLKKQSLGDIITNDIKMRGSESNNRDKNGIGLPKTEDT